MARTTAGRNYTRGQYSFSQVPSVTLQRSTFNRSCALKTAFNSGYLVPIFMDEALPGDTMSLRCQSLVRMSTPIFALMDNVYVDYFFFFIPNRLLWDNWERFCGAQDDPTDTTDFEVPQVTVTPTVGGLFDYLGFVGKDYTVPVTGSALWSRAYNLCFNTWFRSEDLTDSAVVDKGNGPDIASNYVLRRRTKRYDYFSSCLPWTQKGDPVTIALDQPGGSPTFTSTGGGTAIELSVLAGSVVTTLPNGDLVWADPNTSIAINSLREAIQIQRLLERDARGGTRYVEILKSQYGVTSPDFRLQRPEYLGGGSVPVNVHPVASTNRVTGTQTAATVANLGAFATSAGNVGFVKSFVEHGVILGLANVRADISYQQGLERQFSRKTRFEFYWPPLAHLGEQAVLNKEIYYQNTAADDQVFGYQERWAEYRYKPSRTSGLMRGTAAGAIDQWHLGLEFAALPVLNNTFIEDVMPFDRVLATSTTPPEFFGDFWFQYRCARPLPTYSVPGFVDHF